MVLSEQLPPTYNQIKSHLHTVSYVMFLVTFLLFHSFIFTFKHSKLCLVSVKQQTLFFNKLHIDYYLLKNISIFAKVIDINLNVYYDSL